MEKTVKYREVLRALLLGDTQAAQELKSQVPDSEYRGTESLISAVFCVAVEHRFKEDSSPAAVRQFMDEARQNFANSSAFKPLAAEALIRAVLGEDHLFDEVDPDDFSPTQMPVTRKIVSDSPVLQEKIDDLLDDGEKIAAYWANNS